MSNIVNEKLMEEVAYHISLWEGEGIGKYLELEVAKDQPDLERLYELVKQSTVEIFNQEYQPEIDDEVTFEGLVASAEAIRDSLREDGKVF